MAEIDHGSIPVNFKGKNLLGQKFNRLTVIAFSHRQSYPDGHSVFSFWKCLCDCGNESTVQSRKLTTGHSKSCGCLMRESASQRFTKHGGSRSSKKGVHPLYETWKGMHARCNNANHKLWKNYGGRGIAVCDKWSDFSLFVEDMFHSWRPSLTIERKDNNKGYHPDNCIWADRIVQANNKRNTVWVEIYGRIQPVAVWCRELGLNAGSVNAHARKLNKSHMDTIQHFLAHKRAKTPNME